MEWYLFLKAFSPTSSAFSPAAAGIDAGHMALLLINSCTSTWQNKRPFTLFCRRASNQLDLVTRF